MTSEEFVAAVYRVIAELWDDEPQATFQAARRMFAAGADRHDIIHTWPGRPPDDGLIDHPMSSSPPCRATRERTAARPAR